MGDYAYTNPSYSDDDEEEEEEEGEEEENEDYYPVMRYTYLETIAEETSDDLTSCESSESSWSTSDDVEVVSVICNDLNVKKSGDVIQCQIPEEETSKGEQLDKWLEDSMCLGEQESCTLAVFDLECSSDECKSVIDDVHSMIPNSETDYVKNNKNLISQWNEALDFHMKSAPFSSHNFSTKKSSSLDDFFVQKSTTDDYFGLKSGFVCENLSEIDVFEEGYNSEGNVECFNGFVKCCYARSFSDLTQLSDSRAKNGYNKPSNDNLSEDSGFCDAGQGENEESEKKPFIIDVILEEENDTECGEKQQIKVTPTSYLDVINLKLNDIDQSWQEIMLQDEWERSIESGRAATDDWLGLKIKREKNEKMGKKCCSLPSLNSTINYNLEDIYQSFNDHFSAPASLLASCKEKETEVQNKNSLNQCQEEVNVMKESSERSNDVESNQIESACNDLRQVENSKRIYTLPNWEERGWTKNKNLAKSQQLMQSELEVGKEGNNYSTDKHSLSLSLFLDPGERYIEIDVVKDSLYKSMSQLPVCSRVKPISRGVTSTSCDQTPVKFQTNDEMKFGSGKNLEIEKSHMVIVKGSDRKEKSLLHVKALNENMPTDFITVSPCKNQQNTLCKAQRVYLEEDDDDDNAARALGESYHHMERAINYFQQEIRDKNTFHSHQPFINPSRIHISNARQQYFDLDIQKPQPQQQPNIKHITGDFQKQVKDYHDHAIDHSVYHKIGETILSTVTSTPTQKMRSPTAQGSIRSILQSSKRRSRSASYLETDIDSLLSREVKFETCKDDDNSNWSEPIPTPAYSAKALSMLSLRHPHHTHENDDAERARSMEFLLDDDNKVAAQPPENQLMHGEGKILSEHELRVRRSLKRLNVPEWFKNSSHNQKGSFLLKKKEDEQPERWQGLSSHTLSASSIASNGPTSKSNSACVNGTSMSTSMNTMTRITPTYCWRYSSKWSKENLQSPMSPSPIQEKGREFAMLRSNSTSTLLTDSLQTPTQSILTRQPYLGWRSSEKLTREVSNTESTPVCNSSNFYRSAAERLSAGPGYLALRYGGYSSKPSSENSLMSAKRVVSAGSSPSVLPISMHTKPNCKPSVPPKPQLPLRSGLGRSTVSQQDGNGKDAISHSYSSKKGEDSSKSPRQRNIWMESSFVGVKPVFSNGKSIEDERKKNLSSVTTPIEQLKYEANTVLKSRIGFVSSPAYAVG